MIDSILPTPHGQPAAGKQQRFRCFVLCQLDSDDWNYKFFTYYFRQRMYINAEHLTVFQIMEDCITCQGKNNLMVWLH